MRWLKKFHDEHAAVDFILTKLEGNLKDIEHGEASANVIWELKEFVEIINNVIIPHFKAEEKDVYPEALRISEDKNFITCMYDEHKLLYDAFEEFIDSLGEENLETEPQKGDKLARIISKSRNIDKIEVPKNLDQLPEKPVELDVNKEGIISSGYKIIQLLGNHIKKEETQLYEILNKKRT
jgi:hemerythrin-like domain-containing protein